MSGISRAFTTRRSPKRPEISSPYPNAPLERKHSFPGNIRNQKISAPLELISTTNMLSYNAPDLYPSSPTSNSSDDSDRSPRSVSTALTSDSSSIGESVPPSPETNHLTSYFGATVRQSASSDEAPIIPRRALTHTKRSAEILAHKRSTSGKSSQSARTNVRSSINMFSANVDNMDHNPFGNELAQVSELAEEYGISKETLAVVDEEEQELLSRGLFKFHAEDYMSEIHGLFLNAFESRPPVVSQWI